MSEPATKLERDIVFRKLRSKPENKVRLQPARRWWSSVLQSAKSTCAVLKLDAARGIGSPSELPGLPASAWLGTRVLLVSCASDDKSDIDTSDAAQSVSWTPPVPAWDHGML